MAQVGDNRGEICSCGYADCPGSQVKEHADDVLRMDVGDPTGTNVTPTATLEVRAASPIAKEFEAGFLDLVQLESLVSKLEDRLKPVFVVSDVKMLTEVPTGECVPKASTSCGSVIRENIEQHRKAVNHLAVRLDRILENLDI